MRAMRRVVAGRNVFSWASDILEGLESLWTRPLQYAVHGWEEHLQSENGIHIFPTIIVPCWPGSRAPTSSLAFDYDGTLAPIASTPDSAKMRAFDAGAAGARRPASIRV